MPRRRRAWHDRRAAARAQSLAVQEPAVLRRRRRADRDGRARHRAARRPDPSHAADRLPVPGRLHGDLGAAAAQRLRVGVADLSGHPAQPRTAAMGVEAHGAGGRRHAGAVGGAGRSVLRQGVRHRLPRPAALAARPSRRRRPTASRSRPWRCSPALCLLAGILPGLRHRCPGAGRRRHLVGARMPPQSAPPLAVDRSRSPRAAAPTTACWSSCSSPSRRCCRSRSSIASPRAPCGAGRPGTAAFPTRARPPNIRPTASPSRSAACSAGRVPARAKASTCRRPAMRGRLASTSRCATPSGTALRADRGAVAFAAEQLNHLQFLTIRQYLSLVFARPRRPAAGDVRYGPDRRSRRAGRADGRWCWRWRRCCWASRARSRRGCCAGAGRRCCSPTATSCG